MHSVLALWVMTLLSAGTTGGASPENKYVKVEITVVPQALRPGNEGELLARFSPIEGIHVNVDPPVEFRFDSAQVLVLKDDIDLPLDKETGYLDHASPARQTFVVPTNSPPGEYLIKGKIVYYYCSDEEGWCTRFTQPLELTLKVTP